MSVLLPSDIAKPGMLKNDVWIAGMLVRTRERNTETTAIPSGEGKARGDKQGKSDKQRRCLELHVNGGTSPAEVILVGSWDSEATTRLQEIAQVGVAMRFSQVNIKRHNDKTDAWTTSRLPYFVKMFANSIFEPIDANPEWQLYHPLTPLADLHHLKSGSLVCIAGRVIEPPTQKRQGKLGSDHV